MIGILGGTFDPIHLGHLHIANQVVERLGLDELQLMPCARPVHRDHPQASAEQRCDMIRLAIATRPHLFLNTMELERDGPSYTVDSLRQLKAQTESNYLLVLGADAFNGFAGWHESREILRLAHLVICGRPGFRLDWGDFACHRIDHASQLGVSEAGAILPLEVDAIDCSSSELRRQLQGGSAAFEYLPPGVADYIQHHHLYRMPEGMTDDQRNTS